MKKVATYSAILFVMIVFGIIACNPNDDDQTYPGDPRDKFVGSWSVNETCQKRIYTVVIKKDPTNSGQVLIENFADPGMGDPAIGIVTSNRITLDPGYKIGDNWTVSGYGNLVSSKRMEWVFSLIISGSEQSCTATYSR